MHILVIGGTRFVGRHIVEAAVARGHQVTLLHRGKPGAPDPFPTCEHLHLDRNGDLSVLHDRSFDAVVDVSAYVPRQVQAIADALGERAGRYLYISTVSVYDLPTSQPFDETYRRTAVPEDPTTEDVTNETYGGLKVLCEAAASERFRRVTIVRPTYVVGPFDYTHRFTYWVERLARGGEVLAPEPHNEALQIIDARDQGAFVVGLLDDDRDGTFHTVWPDVESATFESVLQQVADAVAPEGTTITWVDASFLAEHGVTPQMLPLWDGGEEGISAPAKPDAALAAGLKCRPISETAQQILAAERAEPQLAPHGGELDSEREEAVLAAWHSR